MSANAIGVGLERLRLQYLDADAATLEQLTLNITAGQWTVLLGRSGCGKTTLLRYLAGLLSDKVAVSGKLQVSDGHGLEHRIAYMAQQDLLMPWLSVLDNVCLSQRFSDRHKEVTVTQSREAAIQLLEKVGLAQYSQAMPSQLSGGMRQRVALARTLMQDKPLVLMDEPFSALDAVTRYKLQNLSAQLLQGKTVVLITHDPQEAVRLANELYVLQGSPASALKLAVPATQTPRQLDTECAQIQQSILDQLERDYD
ncbi:ABC transporter ATP-binding protein [Vibrio agarivorans]|uniref:ABC transporter ATP-binding protein n=1 Tax=Vibrio agarivorans TaxID=153622 RepID=UPI002230614E|nr:ATP-binding cassette domain-containing protein [Vibrio agarivorans]MDN3663706.1 ATP-binding cassette domain-containing protein [Vibrio agarivorans]